MVSCLFSPAHQAYEGVSMLQYKPANFNLKGGQHLPEWQLITA